MINTAMENNSLALWQVYQTAKFSSFSFKSNNRAMVVLLSVWNAGGKTRSAIQNRKLAASICKQLTRNGIEFEVLWGGSEDMCYRELTIAFNVSNVMRAYFFAKLAKQNAFYIVRHGLLTLYATDKSFASKPLGKITRHLVAVPKRRLIYATNQAIAE